MDVKGVFGHVVAGSLVGELAGVGVGWGRLSGNVPYGHLPDTKRVEYWVHRPPGVIGVRDRCSSAMFEVVYYSLTGNTRKVAEAIAAELDVPAENVKTKDRLAEGSFVFLGAGLYGPLRGWGLKRFIERNSFQGRRVALFGTSGEGQGKEVGALEEAVTAKGAEVAGRFHCRGRFLFLVNPTRPSGKDLRDARTFAREVVKE